VIITRKMVIDAVNALLAARFPDSTIYRNREPTEFFRPAFLIMSPTVRPENAARNLIRETLYLTLTCFGVTDDFGSCDADELAEMQQQTIDIFRAGWFKVGDRAVKVTASSGGQDLDRAWVDMTSSYHTIREEPPEYPLMEEINTVYREV